MSHARAVDAAITAYHGALKAHIEDTPPEQRTWPLMRDGGYKIPSREKARVRVEASISAYLKELSE